MRSPSRITLSLLAMGLLAAENDLELARLNPNRFLVMAPDEKHHLTSNLERLRPEVNEGETVSAALEHNPMLQARELEIELK